MIRYFGIMRYLAASGAVAVLLCPPAIAGTPDQAACDVWRAACHYTASSRESSYDINRVVIHKTEGATASGAASWFANCNCGGSAHYTYDKTNGYCYQSVREKDIAWHAGYSSTNRNSVGIEHSGWVSSNDTSTACYDKSAVETRSCVVYYGVPCNRSYIIGHSEVPGCATPGGGGTSCHTDPGRYWNWAYYMSKCNPASPPPPPAPLAVDQLQVSGDFNADGKTDIAWRRKGWGCWQVNYGGGANGNLPPSGNDGRASDFDPRANATIALAGDIDGDGKCDIAWRNRGWAGWYLDSGNGLAGPMAGDNRTDFSPGAQQLQLMGDFNNDGRDDIAWRRTGHWCWLVNYGGAGMSAAYLPLTGDGRNDFDPAGYGTVALAGDFDGDGRCDIAWRNRGWGNWFLDSGNQLSGPMTADNRTDFSPGAQQLQVAGDFNNDGRDDIAWRRTGHWCWLVNYGGPGMSAAYLPLSGDGRNDFDPAGYGTVALAGDIDGDGKCDIGWRNRGWGNWFLDSGNQLSGPMAGDNRTDFDGASSYQVQFVGKFNGDRFQDFAWRRTTWGVWQFNHGGSGVAPTSYGDGRGDFDPSLR